MMALTNARNEASQDEYKVPRVITALGPVPAFTNILASGGRHIRALLSLFDRYGLTVPDDPGPDVQRVLARLRDASQHRHLPAFRRCAERGGRGRRRAWQGDRG